MRDYEELVKALRATRETVRENPGLAMRVPPYQLSAAADAIEELCKACEEAYSNGLLEGGIAQRAEDEKWVSRWISVDERLPEKYDQVLVYGRNGVQIDYYTGEKSVCGNPLFMVSEDKVTHWLYVPVPPKEDDR